jgi:hypothetical protein
MSLPLIDYNDFVKPYMNNKIKSLELPAAQGRMSF